MTTVPTPELERQREIIQSGRAETVQEFIDWIHDQGIRFAEYDPTSRYGRMEPHRLDGRPEQMMADFFGIDRDRIETERRALLDALRDSQ